MNTTFQDLQHANNPHNGQVLCNTASAMALLDELQAMRPPFMCQFVGDNGFSLTVGIDRGYGCVQYAANDGTPPYLMATGPLSDHREMDFLVGDTATPIDGRYRLPFSTLRSLVATFVASGERSDRVTWEEF